MKVMVVVKVVVFKWMTTKICGLVRQRVPETSAVVGKKQTRLNHGRGGLSGAAC